MLSLAGGVTRCTGGKEVCGEEAVKGQFAENVRDPPLRRELKKLLRQDSGISFKALCREAILLSEDDNVRGKTAYACETVAECSAINVTANPDPILLELREAMRKQDEKIELLAREVARLQTQVAGRPRGQGQGPRYDPSGKPICFKCQGVGHIARMCRGGSVGNVNVNAMHNPPPAQQSRDRQGQQGNYLPL